VRDRRIETESESVQIMTAWVAKGSSSRSSAAHALAPAAGTTGHLHEGGRRTFDVANGSAWPDAATAKRRKDAASSDAAGEYLRLAYVALTARGTPPSCGGRKRQVETARRLPASSMPGAPTAPSTLTSTVRRR